MTMEGPNPSDSQDARLAELRREVELLRAEKQQLLEQQCEQTRTIEQLQHRLQDLLRRLYGRSAEKIDPKQLVLFHQLLDQLAPATTAEPTVSTEPAAQPTNGHGRRRLPADLPRQKILHDLPEEDKPCPCCGAMRHVIGQEIHEQLQYVPAKLTVLQHVRLKYACRTCQEHVATAEKPPLPIEKGLAAAGLLAYVIVSKYGDHLPLHRLERILQRHGIQIARSTMCDWAAGCADLLRPLYERMIEQVLRSKVVHTDDTPVDVLDRQRDQTRTGRFWVYLGDGEHPQTVFAYTPSRSRDGPMTFLANWSGHLQADAFGGYDGIYAGQAGGRVVEVACWAHARRKFYDARNSDPAASAQALAYIRLLYDVEVQAKELPAAERQRLRQERSVPLLEQFKQWLESQQAVQGGAILPKSPMGQAIAYALNQWDALCIYTTDGELAIDNNASENALRRVAIGRKNWLFCGSDKGGATAAILFSLIATCQRHKVDPFEYLQDVLTRLPASPLSQLDEFLPDRWQATRAASLPA